MHFCNLIFFMISTTLDLVMLLSYYSALVNALGDSVFFMGLIWGCIIYYVAALYFSYKAYRCFKDQFTQQHSHMQAGYTPFRGGMSNYDDSTRIA